MPSILRELNVKDSFDLLNDKLNPKKEVLSFKNNSVLIDYKRKLINVHLANTITFDEWKLITEKINPFI